MKAGTRVVSMEQMLSIRRCGRPMLFWSVECNGQIDRMRIVYPDGRVEYCITKEDGFVYGCTSREGSPRLALRAVWNYRAYWVGSPHELYFLGYL